MDAPDAVFRDRMGEAYLWWELDEPELARKYLGAAPIQPEFENLLALAELGDPEKLKPCSTTT